MIPYIFALIVLLIACFIVKSKHFDILPILLLLVLSMFRADTVGADTDSYLNDTGYAATGIKTMEVLFIFINGLKPLLGSRIIIYFFSLITIGFIYLASKRFKVNPAMVFFFFVLFDYFNLSLNISRQFASAAVLLYSYSFLFEKGKKRYLFFLYVALAGSIHVSSLVFGLVYFLRNIDLSRINELALVTLILLFYIITDFVIGSFFIEWTQKLLLLDEMSSYGDYLAQPEFLEKGSFGGVLLLRVNMLLNVIVLLRIVKTKSPNSSLVAVLLLLSVFIALFLEQVYGSLGRIKYDITIINIIAYAFYSKFDHSRMKPCILLAIVVFFGYSYIWDLLNGSFGTVPYTFCF